MVLRYFYGQPSIISMRHASRTIALLLIIGLMVQINYVATYCALFKLNHQSIVEKLCEKKTRTCCGKCFLNKKIAATAEQPPSRNESGSTKSPPPPRSPESMPALGPSRNQHHLLRSVCTGKLPGHCCFPVEGYPQPVYQPPEFIPYILA
ncbi:MAG: hypothetical protein HGA97_08735 [Chlorobiaceae bacterium]|nr:hypothetical protein [Chlorobiaceae bacterium]